MEPLPISTYCQTENASYVINPHRAKFVALDRILGCLKAPTPCHDDYLARGLGYKKDWNLEALGIYFAYTTEISHFSFDLLHLYSMI